jgi:hypothetical protein
MYTNENGGQKNFLAAASCCVLKTKERKTERFYILNFGKK